MRALGLLAMLVACGRLGFDPHDGTAGSDATTTANIVFVTSVAVPSRQLAGAGADGLCATHADAARLEGTFRAWVSTSTATAASRLAQARGWVRIDGEPVADRAADVAAGRLFTPILLDELGGVRQEGDLVATATTATGALSTDNCADFTSTTGNLAVGTPLGTTADWTETTTRACGSSSRLYCFGIDHNMAIEPRTTSGRFAFVTSGTWSPQVGDRSTADAVCASEAAAAGLPGSYLAVLATTTATAGSRFSAAGPTWVRPDGVAIGATAEDILDGNLRAPISVTAAGAYVGVSVATGASSIATVATAGSSCADWTSTMGNGATRGSSGTSAARWFDDARYIGPCSSRVALYCFQQ
jgi:hypothetical protein